MSRSLAFLIIALLFAIHAGAAVQKNFRLPISFEPGEGETRFIARGLGYSLFITDTEAVAVVKNATVRIGFSGARRPVITGEDPLPGHANYFFGKDPSKWRTDVPTFRRVVAHGVYEGIDLAYYGSGNDLEYDFIVHPGADPNQIRLSFRGTDRVEQEAVSGDLVLHLPGGAIRQHLPVVYQEDGGRRTRLQARYTRTRSGTFAFDIARFDRTKELVIDPELGWSTYLGGSGNDYLTAIAVDAAGSTYVAGYTDSATLPNFAPNPVSSGLSSVIVAKLDPTGSYLVYATYLGSGVPLGLAVNAAGEAFVAGFAYSADFPTTPHAFQTLFIAGTDGFVTRINSSGNGLIYSTLMGRGSTYISGIGVDAADNAHFAGVTDSPKYPTIGAIQSTLNGSSDAVFSILNASGTGLLYSTFLGGRSANGWPAIVVDSSGNTYLTGSTGSSGFPTTPGSFQPALDGGGWVAKFSADNALVYSTYLGPAAGAALAVDSDGNAYVAGYTRAVNLPVTPGALKPSFNGSNDDSFVTKLNASGTALVYSTYLGGSNFDEISGIAVDASGNAYVCGYTQSSDFPIVNGMKGHLDGLSDAFVTKIDPAGHSILFSTLLGGSNHDGAMSIHVNAAGNEIWIAGDTYSSDFPTVHSLTPGAATQFKPDGFVTNIVFREPDLSIATTHAGDFVVASGPFSFTIRVTNAGTAPTSGTVTVVDTLPAGMTATSMIGAGWSCNVSTATCTTATSIAAGSSYPEITLTASAAPSLVGSVSNLARVSGGGDSNPSNDTATDTTTIAVPRRRSARHS